MTRLHAGAGMAALLAFSLACGERALPVREGDAAAVAPEPTPAETDPRVAVADIARIQGDSAASVWLVMASDFQCPACRYWHAEQSAEIMRDYVATGRVRFAYINYPLSQHQNAVPASEAAMCAGAQQKFWPMHDRIFAAQEQWSSTMDPIPLFRQMAAVAGVDTTAWNQCMVDDVMLPLIDGDRDRGNAGGVGQTPTFFVGSQVVSGAIPAARLRPLLDSAIARAGSGRD